MTFGLDSEEIGCLLEKLFVLRLPESFIETTGLAKLCDRLLKLQNFQVLTLLLHSNTSEISTILEDYEGLIVGFVCLTAGGFTNQYLRKCLSVPLIRSAVYESCV